MSFTEHHYRSRDGLSLYYRSYGSGSNVVLCLPGLTRNCKDFEDLAEHLARMLHQSSTATAQEHALSGFRSVGVLDIVATMPARSSVATNPPGADLDGLAGPQGGGQDARNKASHDALLNRLATSTGATCGLAGPWRVISPDLRGRGQSGWDPKPAHYNLGTYVKDVWNLLDELSFERVVVIGTSLGGLIAMAMAGQQAQRLRGVVLNDIGPEVPPQAVTRILQYAGRTPPAADWNAAAAQARQAYGLAYPDMPEDFWLAYIQLSYRENAAGRLEPDMDPAIGEVLRQPPACLKWLQWLRRHGLMRRMGGISIDPWDSFRALTMPCLLLHGARSDVLTGEIVQRMRAVKPGLQVVTVPDRGHTPLLDEPIALAAVDRFLQRVLFS